MKAVLYLILSSCLTCSFSARLPANVNNSEEACVWSPWLDRDDPSGHCDCEHTSSLFSEGFPGTCQHPIRVEARRKSDRKPVQDLDTEFSFRFFDERGLDCRNADQEGGKRCDDFELRMCCDTHQECKWSNWLDNDNPSGHCDCEEIEGYVKRGFPGTCKNPVKFEARRIRDKKPVEELQSSVTFRVYDTTTGLYCFNADQAKGRCDDYEARMCCSEELACKWSDWFDNDNPSGKCDCEGIEDYVKREFPGTCENPQKFEARRISDKKTAEELQSSVVFRAYDKDTGFYCFNADQANGRCDDYEARMCC